MEKLSSKKPDFTPYTGAAGIGRGVWFMNHLKAFNIIDNIDVESVFRDINLTKDKFPCDNCRQHFQNFCKDYPPREAADLDLKDLSVNKRPENLARWLVDAHNAASQHKFERYPQFYDTKFRPNDVKYEHVREFFDTLGQQPCTSDCEKPDAFKEVPTKALKISQPVFRPKEGVAEWRPKSAPEVRPKPASALRIRIVPAQTQT